MIDEQALSRIGPDEFAMYEEVRRYGRWNMYSREARQATGLDPNTYLEIMRNYAALRKRYDEQREEQVP